MTIDIDLFHVSTGHMDTISMREATKQQEVRLGGEPQPCASYFEANGRKETVPRRGGPRATVLFGQGARKPRATPRKVALDYFKRAYGMCSKAVTLKFVRRFLAEHGGSMVLPHGQWRRGRRARVHRLLRLRRHPA